MWVAMQVAVGVFKNNCVYNSIACDVFVLPLMKVLHWAETFGNSLTVDTGLQFWLVNSQLSIIPTPSHTEFCRQGFHFTMDDPGVKETSSGGVGTRVDYVSVLPTDGLSCRV